jgi:hypothetical protein
MGSVPEIAAGRADEAICCRHWAGYRPRLQASRVPVAYDFRMRLQIVSATAREPTGRPDIDNAGLNGGPFAGSGRKDGADETSAPPGTDRCNPLRR